jgi:hypothetical protein
MAPMATFRTEVFQNEFLPDGGTDVHAIVRVTCEGAGQAGADAGTEAAEIVIVDTSGSMGPTGIAQGRYAASVALQEILDGTWFAVIAGNHVGTLVYPALGMQQMVRMDGRTRAGGDRGGAALPGRRRHGDGHLADQGQGGLPLVPQVTQRHAILLTDGANEHETPEQLTWAIQSAPGSSSATAGGWVTGGRSTRCGGSRRRCSARSTSSRRRTGWRGVRALMRASMARGVPAVDLRVWAPQGAQVLFVKQVAPDLEDITAKRSLVNPLTASFPTGAWADESRDYHVAVRLPAKSVGQEQLASRVQVVVRDAVQAQALVKATWSGDESLTTRIDDQVARYTGQAELAAAIQDGLAAKAAGDEDGATRKLGRAVQIATQTGDEEMTSRLKKVVEIDNAETGTVRLKKAVEKLDEMALDTASTKTRRVKK